MPEELRGHPLKEVTEQTLDFGRYESYSGRDGSTIRRFRIHGGPSVHLNHDEGNQPPYTLWYEDADENVTFLGGYPKFNAAIVDYRTVADFLRKDPFPVIRFRKLVKERAERLL